MLRKVLKDLAKEHFHSIKATKVQLLDELLEMENIEETRFITMDENELERDILDKLNNILKEEEIMWRQRYRVHWLKEGDSNYIFS